MIPQDPGTPAEWVKRKVDNLLNENWRFPSSDNSREFIYEELPEWIAEYELEIVKWVCFKLDIKNP